MLALRENAGSLFLMSRMIKLLVLKVGFFRQQRLKFVTYIREKKKKYKKAKSRVF